MGFQFYCSSLVSATIIKVMGMGSLFSDFSRADFELGLLNFLTMNSSN